MDEKQAVDRALRALLDNPAVGQFHHLLAAAREELARQASPGDVPALRSEVVRRLLRLQVCGYFEAANHAVRPVVEDTATDYGAPRPSPEQQARLSGIPPITELLESVREEREESGPREQAATAAQGARLAPGGGSVTTFIFLADPQPSRAQGADNNNERLVRLSHLNEALNTLDSLTWPSGKQLSCEGERTGPVDGIFFGGDLSQTGGDYDALDQLLNWPGSDWGGWELQVTRHLFQPPFKGDKSISGTRTRYRPSYFGLGNHDIQSEYTPGVIWWSGRYWTLNSPDDYWRDQMWNFICQMHTGVSLFPQSTDPVYPVTSIDADGDKDFLWKKRSFNYQVDLGPVDVYQMHCYGGDSDHGRPDGLDWLRERLREGGPRRPVIIVQHYPFVDYDQVSPHWSQQQRDAFLDLLAPYNVIALLTGHIHSPSAFDQQAKVPSTGASLREFRPGSAGTAGAFALVRVTPTTLDVLFGDGSDGSVQWQQGQGFSIDPFAGWQRVPGEELFTYPPAVYVPADDSVQHVYGVGHNRQLYHNTWRADTQSWNQQWQPLLVGKTVAGIPAVVSATRGRQDIFVVATDGTLVHISGDGTTWSQPEYLGDILHPNVAAVSTSPGQIDVFGWGVDGQLWHLSTDGAGWRWEQRDGPILSAPSVVAWSPTELQMVALGPNSDLLHQWYRRDTGTWSGWESLGGALTSPPVIVAPSPQRLEVFARGTDMSLLRCYWDGRWGTPTSLGGGLASGPTALAGPGPEHIEVLATQLDHTAGRRYQQGTDWGSFTSQGGLCDAPPIPVLNPGSGTVDAFILGVDGHVYRKRIP